MQRLWLIEAEKYNVLPLDDRRYERINPDLAGRPQLVTGNSQTLFAGMRITEASVLTVKNKSHSVTAEGHGPGGRRRGRDHHPGRPRRRLEPVRQAGEAQVLLQLLRHRALLRRVRQRASRPASTSCAWSSSTTAAASPRAATSRWRSTASRSARGASSAPSRWATPRTRRATSAATAARRRRPTTARPATPGTASIAWVRIDLGDDSQDHLVPPEDRIRRAMAHQ